MALIVCVILTHAGMTLAAPGVHCLGRLRPAEVREKRIIKFFVCKLLVTLRTYYPSKKLLLQYGYLLNFIVKHL